MPSGVELPPPDAELHEPRTPGFLRPRGRHGAAIRIAEEIGIETGVARVLNRPQDLDDVRQKPDFTPRLLRLGSCLGVLVTVTS